MTEPAPDPGEGQGPESPTNVPGELSEAALTEMAHDWPFGPMFFLGQLGAFVRGMRPPPDEGLPVVEIHLADGDVLDLCHVMGVAPEWVAPAVNNLEAAEGESRMAADRSVLLLGDAEYASRTLVRDLASRVVFLGPAPMDAALHEPPPYSRRGRPPKVGRRVPSPRLLATARPARRQPVTIAIYGRAVPPLVCTLVCLWARVAGSRLVRAVVTRDPRSRFKDRALFATDPALDVAEILACFSHRWDLDVTFRDLKQVLGLAAPQNGWWRRPAGERSSGRRPGPGLSVCSPVATSSRPSPSSSGSAASSSCGTSSTDTPHGTSRRRAPSPLGVVARKRRPSPTCSPHCEPRSCAREFPRTRFPSG